MGEKQFRPLDRAAEIVITERHLPHWFQADAAMFITFRTADSLPREVLLRWQRELHDWLASNHLPSDLAGSVAGRRATNHDDLLTQLTSKQQRDFKKLSDQFFHHSLDECHGACVLRRPELQKIVAEAVRFYDDQKYDLDCFIIMPNHVHAIVQFRKGFDLNVVGQSWMRYTGREINKLIDCKGAFWQAEPFDHIIRSDQQFHYLRAYIEKNPEAANLPKTATHYWTQGL